MPAPASLPDADPIAVLRRGLIENGYQIVATRGKETRIKGWTTTKLQASQVEGYTRRHSDFPDTGIVCGDVVAVDIDAPDASTAEKLISRLMEIPCATDSPCRTGRAPKCLYLFRASEPYKGKTGAYMINGEKCQVEILGRGTQFAAFGTHPGTGKPYAWQNGNPLTVPFPELPAIDPDTLSAYQADAEAILAGTGGERITKASNPKGAANDNRPPLVFGDGPWADVKTRAFANLDAWVPELGLASLKRRGQGYIAVASFRPSKRAGLPAHKRGQALMIDPQGICDLSDGNKGYSPVDLVMVCLGIEAPAAVDWLRNRVGGEIASHGAANAEEVAAFVERNLAKKVAPSEAEDDEAPPPEAANDDDDRRLPVPPAMHPDPFNPSAAGGILGEIAEWITSTAIIKVSELSLMSAAALVGAMFGDKALGPTSSGVNLFVTTIVKTAGGKGRPPKAIRALADKAGCFGAVSNGDPTSYAAFERIIRKKPSVVAVLDEFGITLQGVNGKKSDAAAVSIRKFLLAIYDQSDSVFDGRVYASSDTKKDDSPIIGPALTVLGMTTPETLYKGISPESVSDGFLNRFVFVEAGEPDSEIQPPDLNATNTPPAHLVAKVQKAITDFPAKAAGPLSPKYSVPFEGGKGSEAHKAWEAVFMWQHHRAWTQIERDINGRVAENTIRLATVRAISRKPTAPAISIEDVRWAWAIVHKSIQIIDHGVKNMTASDPEALRKAIVEALRAARNGELYRSRLMKRSGVKQASMNEYMAAMAWLYASGEVDDISADGDGSKLRLVSHER